VLVGRKLEEMVELAWKENWRTSRERLESWWRREGPALCVMAPREKAVEDIPEPVPPAGCVSRWTNPEYRLQRAEHEMSRTYFGGEAFPYFDPHIGPGNLATFIGSEPEFADDTVWFNPCIVDPEAHPCLSFDPSNRHFRTQMEIIEKGISGAAGKYLVGIPDLIENIDVLVSLRGMENLLSDMIDRPEWVECKVSEINKAWLEVFDAIRERVKDPWGGNTWSGFRIWSPGRTVKLQCDASAAFSPAMFRRFVLPALSEQCRWVDRTLYHLDGTQCIRHLDALLTVPELDAIEWTPQAGRPGGGNPEWYDLYRRIIRAGKCVQAIDVAPTEVIPLLDAVGPKGMFIMTRTKSEEEARRLERRVDSYR
jgi:hypothetical protein